MTARRSSPDVSFRVPRGSGLLAAIDARGSHRGPVVRRDLDHYYTLLEDALRRVALTAAEARLLADAAAPVLEHAEHTNTSMPAHRWLWAELDNVLRERPAMMAQDDAASFVARIRALSTIESRAVVDALQRYRVALANGAADTEALLAELGLACP